MFQVFAYFARRFTHRGHLVGLGGDVMLIFPKLPFYSVPYLKIRPSEARPASMSPAARSPARPASSPVAWPSCWAAAAVPAACRRLAGLLEGDEARGRLLRGCRERNTAVNLEQTKMRSHIGLSRHGRCSRKQWYSPPTPSGGATNF